MKNTAIYFVSITHPPFFFENENNEGSEGPLNSLGAYRMGIF
jgi:hypothetical protein